MGMHFGILTVACDQETLLRELRSRAGDLRETEPTTEEEEHGDIDVHEQGGRTWVMDRRIQLSACPDLMLQLSAIVPDRVIAYYAETLLASFGLVVARAGRLRRLYHNCRSTLSRPLSIGKPYPFDAELESIDGGGMFALLEHYGLDPRSASPLRSFDFTPKPGLNSGPLRRAIAEHEAKHALPPERQPPIVAVGRIVHEEPPPGR